MLYAFSTENKSSDFDWNTEYGAGFDVLHMSNSRKLFLSGDPTVDLRAQLMLTELDVSWTLGSTPFSFNGSTRSTAPLKFVDNDPARTAVEHDSAILLYLDAVYNSPGRKTGLAHGVIARQYARLIEAGHFLNLWRDPDTYGANIPLELKKWAGYARENSCIAGKEMGLADYALLPVLKEIQALYGMDVLGDDLRDYYLRMGERKGVQKCFEASI